VWGCEVFFYCCFSFYHSYFLYIIFPFMHLAIWNTYFIIFIVQFHHQITEDLKKPKSPPNCFSCLFIMVYFLEYKTKPSGWSYIYTQRTNFYVNYLVIWGFSLPDR
jgi:hypothetical protein